MQKYRLNKFIILSVALHVILISAVLLYFFKNPLSGGKSGTVMVGIVSAERAGQNKTSAQIKANDSESKKQVSKPKIVLEKKPIKKNIKSQKNTKAEIQEITKNETKSLNKPEKAITSGSLKNNKTQKAIQSASLRGEVEFPRIQTKNPGAGAYNNSLAYPDYNFNPKPKYPRAARKRGFEGEVKLKVFVLADGRVGKIEVIRPSGHQILDESALEAVKDWVFIPGKENGKEISSWVTVPITFQLKNS